MGALESPADSGPKWPEAPEGLAIVAHQSSDDKRELLGSCRASFRATWNAVLDRESLVWERKDLRVECGV